MTATSGRRRLNFFERYLTLWVAACMVIGVALGKLLPGAVGALRTLEFGEGDTWPALAAALRYLPAASKNAR